MTKRTKVIAAAAVLAAAGLWLWSVADPGPTSPVPPSTGEAPVAAVAARAGEPVVRDAAARPDERTLVSADVPATASTSREVRVVDEAGEAVAGATVLFVKPGFVYADLEPAHADVYSRSTEVYLRDFGLAQLTDERGITQIPIAAAYQVVTARKGLLYGTNWPRTEGAFQRIVVTAHHTLVVETVDARGTPVPHVKVVGVPVPSNVVAVLMSQWTLGTTDDYGRLTQTLGAQNEQVVQWRLHAELLDGPHGHQTIDTKAPPSFVRLVLPDTGTVCVRLQHADGSAPDRRVLESIKAELGLVGARPQATLFAQFQGGPSGLDYENLDAEGNARFQNLVFGQNLKLRFPGMIVTTKTFAGPTAAGRVVRIVHTIAAEHPFVTGTLVDADGRPICNATFSLLAPAHAALQLARGGKTDAHGRFVVWLSDRCSDQRDVVLQLGMDWDGTGPARQVGVRIAGPLLGKVDLGTVVMPNAK